jgi:hypothetical protein
VDNRPIEMTEKKCGNCGATGSEYTSCDCNKQSDLDKIIKELPQLLVTHAYAKLKSGDNLTASEMKVCLDVCKTYSTDSLQKKPDNILDDVPFDTDE